MSIASFIVDRFLGDHLQRQVERGVSARLEEVRAASSRNLEEQGYRRLTGDQNRDLQPLTHDRQREIAVHLYQYNPVARRILNAIQEWILGEGISVSSEHPRTNQLLQGFWSDRINKWDVRLWEQTLELFLMGERFWPVASSAFSGTMHFGVIDPAYVKRILTDPENIEIQLGVVLGDGVGREERRIRTVITEEDLQLLSSAGLKMWEEMKRKEPKSELFAFAVNKLSTQTRGTSEIFSIADWLDGYEQLLFSILQREKLAANFIWDVTIDGADDAKIQDFIAKTGMPKPMSMRVHNEKVKYEMNGPQLGSATNNTEHARLFRNHSLGGMAMPGHWYADGGDVNRATAAEMGTPTEKAMTAKQRTVKLIMNEVIRVQIARWRESGELTDTSEEALGFEVTFPEPSTRDLTKIATSMQSVASALSIASDQGWVDEETAATVVASMLQQMGVERDVDEMLERGREQRGKRLVDHAADALKRKVPA